MTTFTRHVLRAACLAVAAWALCQPAHARSATLVIYESDVGCGWNGACISYITGGISFAPSSTASASLAGSGLVTSRLETGGAPVSGDGLAFEVPITSIRGTVDIESDVTFSANRFSSFHTVQLSQPGAAEAGTLQFKGLKVDLSTNQVLANVIRQVGAGAAVTVNDLPIMSWGITVGQSALALPDARELPGTFSLQDVALTPEAVDLFRQTFQLSDAGVAALSQRGGSLSINYALGDVSGFAALVPEPSTWALMGLGLAGLAFVRRRDASSAQGPCR